MAFDLDPSYKQVPERIADFKAKHPEGCLRPADLDHPYRIEVIDGRTFIVYVAAAYRTPDDPCPGIGMAYEQFPGATPYTKNSELMNAETSAWGRAIVAVLASESKAVASAEDVRNRRADEEAAAETEKAVPGLRTSIEGAIRRLTDEQRAELKAWMAEENLPAVRRMNARQCDQMLDRITGFPPPSPSEEVGEEPVRPPAPGADPASSDAPQEAAA